MKQLARPSQPDIALREFDPCLTVRAERALERSSALIARGHTLIASGRQLVERAAAAGRIIKPVRAAFVWRRTIFVMTHLHAMPAFVPCVVKTVSANLGRRQTLTEVGRRMGRSPWHLNVAFDQATGITIHEFTTCLRMVHAAREIRRGGKIEAIAKEIGYQSTKTFYRQFELLFDMKPSEFRCHPSPKLWLPGEHIVPPLNSTHVSPR